LSGRQFTQQFNRRLGCLEFGLFEWRAPKAVFHSKIRTLGHQVFDDVVQSKPNCGMERSAVAFTCLIDVNSSFHQEFQRLKLSSKDGELDSIHSIGVFLFDAGSK